MWIWAEADVLDNHFEYFQYYLKQSVKLFGSAVNLIPNASGKRFLNSNYSEYPNRKDFFPLLSFWLAVMPLSPLQTDLLNSNQLQSVNFPPLINY